MYRVPPFRPRLYLLRIDGARREFKYVEAAARQLTRAFLRDEVGLDFGVRHERRWPLGSRLVAIPVDYILRDELGNPVAPAEVLRPDRCDDGDDGGGHVPALHHDLRSRADSRLA